MTQKFCTECGREITPNARFCTSCGKSQTSVSTSPADHDEFGPLSLPMPDGSSRILLHAYEGERRTRAITLINRLNGPQREVWVAAGQPDILLWPGGDFAAWLGALSPEHYAAARDAQTPPPPSTSVPGRTPATASNGIATAGFVLSLVGVFTFSIAVPAILGFIFGIAGASKARGWERQGQAPVGKGLAIAAISVSSFTLVIWLATLGLYW